MRFYTKKRVAVAVLMEVRCNKCGDTTENYVRITHSGSYTSKGKIKDGDTFDFDICETCLGRYMTTFVIEPTYTNFLDGSAVVPG